MLQNILFGGCIAVLWVGIALAQQGSDSAPSEVDKGPRITVESAAEGPTPIEGAAKGSERRTEPAESWTESIATVKGQGQGEPPCGPRCQEARQNERDDLVAQQSMARATDEIVTVSWWQLGMAFAGTAMLLFTLKLTRDANRVSQTAAAAALDSNAIARENAKKELRAYLFVEKIKLEKHPHTGEVNIIVRLKNFGQTPASNIKYYVTHAYVVDEHSGRFLPTEQSITSYISPIGPSGCTDVAHGIEMASQEWKTFVRGGYKLYSFGKFIYTDAFGDRHGTWFRLRKENDGVKEFSTEDYGNRYT